MNLKTNLYLALTLIVVGSAAYWYEFKKVPETEKKSENQKKLLAFEQSTELESLKIRFKDKAFDHDIELNCLESCKLSDVGGKWEMTRPLKFHGDEGNIVSFISSLSTATISETVTLDGDTEKKLAAFGLDKDRRELRKAVLKVKGQKNPVTVYVGEDSPLGDTIYAMVEGEGFDSKSIRLVPGFVRSNFQRSLSYFRNKKILDIAASRIEKLEVSNAGGTTVVSKKDGNWFFTNGQPADNEMIDNYVTGLVYTSVSEYVSDDRAKDAGKYGTNGAAKFKVKALVAPAKEDKIGKPQNVVLSFHEKTIGKDPKIFVTVDSANFIGEIDRSSVDKYSKKPRDFKFKYLLAEKERGQLRRMKVNFFGKNKSSVEFKSKDGSVWELEKGAIADFEPTKVFDVAQKIMKLKATDYIDQILLPKTHSAVAEWVLMDPNSKVMNSITIYSKGDVSSDYYGKFKNGDFARLDKPTVSPIPADISGFQKAKAPATAPVTPPEPKHDHSHGDGHDH